MKNKVYSAIGITLLILFAATVIYYVVPTYGVDEEGASLRLHDAGFYAVRITGFQWYPMGTTFKAISPTGQETTGVVSGKEILFKGV